MSRPLTSLLFKMLYARKWNKSLEKRMLPDFKANLYYHVFLVDDDLESARSIVKKLDGALL